MVGRREESHFFCGCDHTPKLCWNLQWECMAARPIIHDAARRLATHTTDGQPRTQYSGTVDVLGATTTPVAFPGIARLTSHPSLEPCFLLTGLYLKFLLCQMLQIHRQVQMIEICKEPSGDASATRWNENNRRSHNQPNEPSKVQTTSLPV